MKVLAALGLGAMLLLGPATALACGGGPGVAYLHRTLPSDLPHDAFVAEVELELDDSGLIWGDGVSARVRRLIQGEHHGETLILRPDVHYPGCDRPFGNGASGFLIGRPRGMSQGRLVVDPIHAPASPEPSALDILLRTARQGEQARPLP